MTDLTVESQLLKLIFQIASDSCELTCDVPAAMWAAFLLEQPLFYAY